MEDLFDILIVIVIALLGIASKNSKKKKAAASPAKAPEPASKPISEAQKSASRRNVEAAVSAFAELLDDESLPNPDKPIAVKIPAAIEAAVRKMPEPAKVKTSIEDEAAKKQHLAKLKTLGAPASGESKTDAHGCIGGSMPDHESEGETIAEHAAHEQNRQQKLAEEAAFDAVSLRRPTAADLRRAVVMSEVLDKPVSLRGRRI